MTTTLLDKGWNGLTGLQLVHEKIKGKIDGENETKGHTFSEKATVKVQRPLLNLTYIEPLREDGKPVVEVPHSLTLAGMEE
ncbi:hypothetical protein LIER_33860 [Lithospermum erythrorhizon]|uniref:Uncharacterized protein n=1 Tax=Lithospermum erythrorhizon TaxID=34254 RepID=A0AAV3S1R1_LITER